MARGAGVALAIVVLVLLALAGPASASTQRQISQKIFADLADNGRLDGHYTRGQINRALHAPSLQGYERTGAPAPTPGITSSDPPGPGSARGALPFGGLDLALFGGVGGPLLILGASLGRLARVRARD